MIQAHTILIAIPFYILLVITKLFRKEKIDIKIEGLKAVFFTYLLTVVMFFLFPIVTDRICNPIGMGSLDIIWLPENDYYKCSLMNLLILAPLGFFFPMYHRHYTQKESFKIGLMTVVLINALQIILSAYGYYEARPIIISALILNVLGFMIGSKLGLHHLSGIREKKFDLVYHERN